MADLSSLQPGDAIVALRTLPRRLGAALGVLDDASEARAHRLGPEGVSAVDILLASIATWGVLTDALRRVMLDDDPLLHPAVADRTLRALATSVSEPSAVVLEQVASSIADLVAVADSITGHGWARTGRSGAATYHAIDLLRDAVEVGVDALARIERTLASFD